MDFMQVFDMFQNNILGFLYYAGVFVVVLSLLVFVHEWGHYIVARMCGVKVKTFSVGFGKELVGFNDSHGTRWKISLVPLGGYVQFFGDMNPASTGHTDMIEDEELGDMRKMTEQEKKDAFFAKPVWKRSLVVFAGPAINYIFAIIVLAGLYIFNGQSVTPPIASAIGMGSAAHEAGFMPHDKIISIDGKKVTSFQDVRREMMISLDQEKVFVIDRGGEQIVISATPERVTQNDRFGFQNSRGVLGVVSPEHGLNLKGIVKIDGQDVRDADEAREVLLTKMGRYFMIEVMVPGGNNDQYMIQPMLEYNEKLNDPEDKGYNVVYFSDPNVNNFVKYSPFVAVYEAVEESVVITHGIIEALGQIIMGTRSAKELGGIIRIGAVAGDMAQQGLVSLLLLMALLSINLGFINLLPIPVLDGGHLLFYGFEAAFGKPIPHKVQEYGFNFGLIFLVAVMVFTNLNDVVQLFL